VETYIILYNSYQVIYSVTTKFPDWR
jgi:hypothetical protein